MRQRPVKQALYDLYRFRQALVPLANAGPAFTDDMFIQPFP